MSESIYLGRQSLLYPAFSDRPIRVAVTSCFQSHVPWTNRVELMYHVSSQFRHGWGCEADTTKAVQYLSAAASNAASIEQLALQAGLKKGGAAKGELVLAIFELANCFRHGWGIEKDAYAAKQVSQGRVSSKLYLLPMDCHGGNEALLTYCPITIVL